MYGACSSTSISWSDCSEVLMTLFSLPPCWIVVYEMLIRSVSMIFSQILKRRLRKQREIWNSRQSLMLLFSMPPRLGAPSAAMSVELFATLDFSAKVLQMAVSSMITLDRAAGLNYQKNKSGTNNNLNKSTDKNYSFKDCIPQGLSYLQSRKLGSKN